MRDSFHLCNLRIPPGGANNDAATERQDGAHVFYRRLRRREVDDHIDAGQHGSRKRRGALIFCNVERPHAMAAFASDLSDQASGFSFSQHQKEHLYLTGSAAGLRASTSKISGSGSLKKVACRERTASSASSSSIMKLMLISLAPCEIMRTLIWRIAENTRAAMPLCPRMSSPTMQISAFLPSYFTSASLLRSAAIAGSLSFESTVSDTETSLVETISTGHLCLSKMAKISLR